APGDPLAGPFVLPRRGLVREAAERWFRRLGRRTPDVAAEPEGHEALLTLVALGYGTGIVPRLLLDTSALRHPVTGVPVHRGPGPGPFTVGLCVGRADLRRPLVATLWSLAPPG